MIDNCFLVYTLCFIPSFRALVLKWNEEAFSFPEQYMLMFPF